MPSYTSLTPEEQHAFHQLTDFTLSVGISLGIPPEHLIPAMGLGATLIKTFLERHPGVSPEALMSFLQEYNARVEEERE